MRLHLTNGSVGLTMGFDPREQNAIVNSKRPIQTALKFAKRRLDRQAEGDAGTWYPINGIALEGLPQ